MISADGLYGVSLAAAITAVVLYVRSDNATPEEGLSLTASPDGASVTFSARF
jgi:hypothetical protein